MQAWNLCSQRSALSVNCIFVKVARTWNMEEQGDIKVHKAHDGHTQIANVRPGKSLFKRQTTIIRVICWRRLDSSSELHGALQKWSSGVASWPLAYWIVWSGVVEHPANSLHTASVTIHIEGEKTTVKIHSAREHVCVYASLFQALWWLVLRV